MPQHDSRPPICDYEGSNYRTEFWEGRGRNYEDQVERLALERLLPEGGRRMLEVGAGFGRLTNEYDAFNQVVLLDYSLSQLQYAQEHLGRSPRYVYVAADAYHLPFHPGVFDAATMVRVIHHMAHVDAVLEQVRRVLVPSGVFILEHANKRNLKAMLRYALRQQSWNPYDERPVEFVELNFDFHPEYIRRELQRARFGVADRIPVSLFRLDQLKDNLPVDMLTRLDRLFQDSGLLIAPSVFVRSIAIGLTPNNLDHNMLFACPECGGELVRHDNTITCLNDGLSWSIRDGIYDFKAPIESDE